MHQSLFKDNDSHKESNEGHSRKTTKLTKVDGGEHPSRHDQSATTASRWLCETQSKESRWWRRPESVGEKFLEQFMQEAYAFCVRDRKKCLSVGAARVKGVYTNFRNICKAQNLEG
ncbi:hypothetical protein JHK85_004703 [Glycine max]|nr:hypothetical protein JHK85_004703 [Glycine max]